MSWLSHIVRPKIRALVSSQPKEIPDNLWRKCGGCGEMIFHRDYAKNLHVCHHCGHHGRISAEQRMTCMFDGPFTPLKDQRVPADPLKFRDKKRYADRLKEARETTRLNDVLQVGAGEIGGIPAIVAAFAFTFMGGSMGTAVGEAFVAAAEQAIDRNAAFIVVPASGGARMQEGILSLMQMARTTVAVRRLRAARLPVVVLLTDPTTGGVTASFAMIGDITLAEPGAMIGFAGKRVIEETIREKLPADFQTAEYLLEHGMIDRIVRRRNLNQELGRILRLLMQPQAA